MFAPSAALGVPVAAVPRTPSPTSTSPILARILSDEPNELGGPDVHSIANGAVPYVLFPGNGGGGSSSSTSGSSAGGGGRSGMSTSPPSTLNGVLNTASLQQLQALQQLAAPTTNTTSGSHTALLNGSNNSASDVMSQLASMRAQFDMLASAAARADNERRQLLATIGELRRENAQLRNALSAAHAAPPDVVVVDGALGVSLPTNTPYNGTTSLGKALASNTYIPPSLFSSSASIASVLPEPWAARMF